MRLASIWRGSEIGLLHGKLSLQQTPFDWLRFTLRSGYNSTENLLNMGRLGGTQIGLILQESRVFNLSLFQLSSHWQIKNLILKPAFIMCITLWQDFLKLWKICGFSEIWKLWKALNALLRRQTLSSCYSVMYHGCALAHVSLATAVCAPRWCCIEQSNEMLPSFFFARQPCVSLAWSQVWSK